MKPGSLLRACGQCIAQNLMKNTGHLIINETWDKERLVTVLTSFLEWYGDIIYSNIMMQDQLYRNIISRLRTHSNPSVHFTLMLILCPKVTIDQIAVIEDHNGLPPLVAGTGLDINSEECDAILDVVSCLKVKMSSKKKMLNLPTTSLVLEGIYFHDPDFLPNLFKEMPNLLHIELQYNGTPYVLRSLSKHCPRLESLSFLEPRMEVSVLEKDILPILYGVPASSVQRNSSLLSRFAEDQNFRSLFKVQYPKLKKLNLDELYFEEEYLYDVYTLALILHPKLTSFGKHSGLTRNILSKFRRLWAVINEGSLADAELFLTKAKFVDSVFDVPSDNELELRYTESIVSMFKSLKSVELQKQFWNEREIGEFCRMFAHQVEAISLNELPISQISCLSSIKHLRLTFTRQYSFDQVHLILDNCIHLQTLSIHSVFHEHSQHRQNGANPMQHFGRMMEEEHHILENLLVEDLANHMQDIQAFIGEAQDQGIPLEEGANAPEPPQQPSPQRSGTKYKNLKTHHKLLTLRIASLFEAAKHPSEAFLLSLLERLPNLHHLCLGMWMGALSQRRDHLTCTGNALVSVITSEDKSKPLLTELEQLCCLPSGTESEMCTSLVSLAESLPSLHTIIVPALDTFLLSPTLSYFKHSNVEIRHKCATDQMFSNWEPEH